MSEVSVSCNFLRNLTFYWTIWRLVPPSWRRQISFQKHWSNQKLQAASKQCTGRILFFLSGSGVTFVENFSRNSIISIGSSSVDLIQYDSEYELIKIQLKYILKLEKILKTSDHPSLLRIFFTVTVNGSSNQKYFRSQEISPMTVNGSSDRKYLL